MTPATGRATPSDDCWGFGVDLPGVHRESCWTVSAWASSTATFLQEDGARRHSAPPDRAVIHRVHGELFGFQVVEQKKHPSSRPRALPPCATRRTPGAEGRVPALRDAAREARRRDGLDAVSLCCRRSCAPFGCLVSLVPPIGGSGLPRPRTTPRRRRSSTTRSPFADFARIARLATRRHWRRASDAGGGLCPTPTRQHRDGARSAGGVEDLFGDLRLHHADEHRTSRSTAQSRRRTTPR